MNYQTASRPRYRRTNVESLCDQYTFIKPLLFVLCTWYFVLGASVESSTKYKVQTSKSNRNGLFVAVFLLRLCGWTASLALGRGSEWRRAVRLHRSCQSGSLHRLRERDGRRTGPGDGPARRVRSQRLGDTRLRTPT